MRVAYKGLMLKHKKIIVLCRNCSPGCKWACARRMWSRPAVTKAMHHA